MNDGTTKAASTLAGNAPLPLNGPDEKADKLPDKIGRFEIKGRIKRSGMAVVYRAYDPKNNRTVALKMPLRKSIDPLPEPVRLRFLREIAITAKLNEVGVVPLFESDVEQGYPFYTMPLIKGCSLCEHVRVAQPSRGQRLALFLSLCKLVGAVHKAGYIHRDLKPPNVMVEANPTDKEEVKVHLLDFGLATEIEETQPRLTEPDQILGTPGFMAPEQISNRLGGATPATDVCALGSILYELLSGEPAFVFPPRGDDSPEDHLDKKIRIMQEVLPKPPSQVGRPPRPSRDFDKLVMGCLSKEPAGRPQSVEALTIELQTIIEKQRRAASWRIALAMLSIVGLIAMFAFGKFPRDTSLVPVAKATQVDPAANVAPTVPPALIPVTPLPAATVPVPVDLWWQLTPAKAALRDDFDKRRMGAVLLHYQPATADTRPVTLRLVPTSGPATAPQRVAPNGAAVFYAPTGTAVFELVTSEETTRWSVAVTESEVTYAILR